MREVLPCVVTTGNTSLLLEGTVAGGHLLGRRTLRRWPVLLGSYSTWNKETVGWVMVELAQVLEDEISSSVPAAPASLTVAAETASRCSGTQPATSSEIVSRGI